jgi:DNA ligase-1
MLPMLAADCEGDVRKIRFPVLASPKLDGIRAFVMNGQLVSRSLKPIRNAYVQGKLAGLAEGVDGELIVGEPTRGDVFRRSSSGVMSAGGQPNFRFHVFDRQPVAPISKRTSVALPIPFSQRLMWCQANLKRSAYTAVVDHVLIHDESGLLICEQAWLVQGYEGAMVRDPNGPYKEGRATLTEGWLTKVKRFRDAEALVIGYKELLHNENEAKINALGQTERSSHKANKRASGMLGALILRTPEGLEFGLGTGFSKEERILLWAQRESLPGRMVKYRFFPIGHEELPRFPTWHGFRDKEDM